MPSLRTLDVFTPDGFPTHTYVQRDDLHHERLLREWALGSQQIASISGPSKAGKTVLVQRVVGEGNLITVSGASVRAPDQLWERVLDWWGEPHSMTASNLASSTETSTHERAVQLGVTGTNTSHRGGSGTAKLASETTQATVNRRGLPQVVQEMANTQYTVLLDDFHYIPAAIQGDVAQQLKDAASRGVRICVASVPHRADNVVRALPELRGRVVAIDLDYWGRRDLIQIAKLGLPLLGLEIDNASLQMLATEASGSPQLMQLICRWMCNHLGVRTTAEPARTVVLDDLARKEVLFLTSSTTDFRSLVRALIAGPKVKAGERKMYMHHDGRSGDVYLTVMRAIAMEPKLAVDKDELMRRLEVMCNGAHPDAGSVVRACAT